MPHRTPLALLYLLAPPCRLTYLALLHMRAPTCRLTYLALHTPSALQHLQARPHMTCLALHRPLALQHMKARPHKPLVLQHMQAQRRRLAPQHRQQAPTAVAICTQEHLEQ